MSEYTDEQKGKILKTLLLQTPHGEAKDVLTDLKKIVGNNIINDQWTKESMNEYNKRRFTLLEGDTTKIIVCPQGEVEPYKYLNPDTKKICAVDPIQGKIINESDASNLVATGNNETYRSKLSEKLKNYLTSFYEDGTNNAQSMSRGFGYVFASSQGQIAVVISFKNLNLNNYWTGGWQSEWTFNVSNKGTTKLEGRIRLNVHYFEDGNVQLNSTFNENGEIEVSDPETTADNVINTISTLENDFQKRLEKFYVEMHESTFKNMRRFLPKIGKKVDWRSSVHALAQEAASK